MKTRIKKLAVEMELKSKGMEIEIRDNDNNFWGDMIISKTGLSWCRGKTQPKNAPHKSWEEVIDFFNT